VKTESAWYHLRQLLSRWYISLIVLLVGTVFLVGCVTILSVTVAVTHKEERVYELPDFISSPEEYQALYDILTPSADSVYTALIAEHGIATNIPEEYRGRPYMVSLKYFPSTNEHRLVGHFFLKCPCGSISENILVAAVDLETKEVLLSQQMSWSDYKVGLESSTTIP